MSKNSGWEMHFAFCHICFPFAMIVMSCPESELCFIVSASHALQKKDGNLKSGTGRAVHISEVKHEVSRHVQQSHPNIQSHRLHDSVFEFRGVRLNERENT